jgi:hypothetical protein
MFLYVNVCICPSASCAYIYVCMYMYMYMYACVYVTNGCVSWYIYAYVGPSTHMGAQSRLSADAFVFMGIVVVHTCGTCGAYICHGVCMCGYLLYAASKHTHMWVCMYTYACERVYVVMIFMHTIAYV